MTNDEQKVYYRFDDGSFVKAKTFEEAKNIKISELNAEIEDPESWHECTCLGLSHNYDCHVMKDIIPF